MFNIMNKRKGYTVTKNKIKPSGYKGVLFRPRIIFIRLIVQVKFGQKRFKNIYVSCVMFFSRYYINIIVYNCVKIATNIKIFFIWNCLQKEVYMIEKKTIFYFLLFGAYIFVIQYLLFSIISSGANMRSFA